MSGATPTCVNITTDARQARRLTQCPHLEDNAKKTPVRSRRTASDCVTRSLAFTKRDVFLKILRQARVFHVALGAQPRCSYHLLLPLWLRMKQRDGHLVLFNRGDVSIYGERASEGEA